MKAEFSSKTARDIQKEKLRNLLRRVFDDSDAELYDTAAKLHQLFAGLPVWKPRALYLSFGLGPDGVALDYPEIAKVVGMSIRSVGDWLNPSSSCSFVRVLRARHTLLTILADYSASAPFVPDDGESAELIESLKLSNRLYSALRRNGIHTIERLTSYSEKGLRRKCNAIGPRLLDELKTKLAAGGYSLHAADIESLGVSPTLQNSLSSQGIDTFRRLSEHAASVCKRLTHAQVEELVAVLGKKMYAGG